MTCLMETQSGIDEKTYRAIVSVVDRRMREIRVTRKGFDALKSAVIKLAEAQKRTEHTLDRLTVKVEELATKVEELAEAKNEQTKDSKNWLKLKQGQTRDLTNSLKPRKRQKKGSTDSRQRSNSSPRIWMP